MVHGERMEVTIEALSAITARLWLPILGTIPRYGPLEVNPEANEAEKMGRIGDTAQSLCLVQMAWALQGTISSSSVDLSLRAGIFHCTLPRQHTASDIMFRAFVVYQNPDQVY